MKRDAVVIGGGTNGLAAACALARAGRSVVLCERSDRFGGLAASDAFHPRYRTNGTLVETDGLREWVVRELELEKHGLRWREREAPVLLADGERPGVALHPQEDARTREEIARVSARDAEGFGAWRALVQRFAPFVRRLLDHAPPDPDAEERAGLFELAATGVALRLLGARDMTDLLRVAPTSLADWLAEPFESELLKSGLAAPGLAGTWMGPRSAGGSSCLLARECARGRSVAGGAQALVDALVAAARASGVELRISSEVKRIRVVDGRARGVELADGEAIEAELVASGAGPKRTLLELVPPTAVQPSVAAAARGIRSRGGVARMDLALAGPLEFAGRPGERFERARTGGTLDAMERAFDALKYRRASERPWLEVFVPSLERDDLAPRGHHVASLFVHHAPFAREGGWNDAAREALARAALDELARHAPNVRDLVVAHRIETPDVLAERLALDGGHLHHAELALDQALFLRPTASCARYATPLEGLWLCGSGSHPGGGLTCAPGALAARAMLVVRGRRA